MDDNDDSYRPATVKIGYVDDGRDYRVRLG